MYLVGFFVPIFCLGIIQKLVTYVFS